MQPEMNITGGIQQPRRVKGELWRSDEFVPVAMADSQRRYRPLPDSMRFVKTLELICYPDGRTECVSFQFPDLANNPDGSPSAIFFFKDCELGEFTTTMHAEGVTPGGIERVEVKGMVYAYVPPEEGADSPTIH